MRESVTKYSPYVLVTMSAYLAIRQFIALGYSFEKIVVIAIVMFCIVWLLSETFELWTNATGTLKKGYLYMGLFLVSIEIYLGHYGWAWLFGGEGIFADALHYAISIGFSCLTVFGKYLYSRKQDYDAVAPVVTDDAASLLEAAAEVLSN